MKSTISGSLATGGARIRIFGEHLPPPVEVGGVEPPTAHGLLLGGAQPPDVVARRQVLAGVERFDGRASGRAAEQADDLGAQLPRLVELELPVGRAHGTEALHASQIVGAIHHLERTPVVYSRRP